MANIKISQLPPFTASSTADTWLVLNNSGQTETFKIEKESFISNTYTTITGVTLASSGWTYNSGTTYYDYTYSNTGITSTSIVDFTPNSASLFTALTSRVQPLNTVATGSSIFISQYAPSGDITGTINIFKQTL
jgi:hypothetical protein